MPAPLRIQLNGEEDRALHELSLKDGVPSTVKQRATALRLNAAGRAVPWIARHLKQNEHTVRSTIRRWKQQGMEGLWDEPRSGRPRRWQPEDKAVLEAWLQEPHRYSVEELCERLAQEREITLSPRQMRRVLKECKLAQPKRRVISRPRDPK